MNRPVITFTEDNTSNISPTVLMLDQHRAMREDDILTRLVMHFNQGELTEKEAFLAVAEIAAVRNLIISLRK